MTKKLFLNHKEPNSFCYKISYFLEKLQIIFLYFFSVFIYYLLIAYKANIIHEIFSLKYLVVANYIVFFILSFFMSIKASNSLRNIIFLFIFVFIDKKNKENKEMNIHYLSFYFIVICLSNFLNFVFLKLFRNLITLKDVFNNGILFILSYFIFDPAIIFLQYLFTLVIKEEIIESGFIIDIIIIFASFFYLGSFYYEKITKTKKPSFGTVIRRSLFVLLENITAGFYFFKLFEKVKKQHYMKESFLFLLFLVGLLKSGFILEFIFKKMQIFEKLRKHFYIWFYILILLFYFPYIKDEVKFLSALVLMIIISIIIKCFKIKILGIFSDLLIFAFLLYLFYGSSINDIIVLILIIYIIKIILEYGISRVDFGKCLAYSILNVLLFISMIENKIDQRKEEDKDKLMKNLSEKYIKNKKNNDSYAPLYMFDEKEKQELSFFYPPSYGTNKYNENSCLAKIIKSLYKYINKSSNKKNIPQLKKYNLEQILEISNKIMKKEEIKKKLKENYNNTLIDNEMYKPEWSKNISEKYMSKFALFSMIPIYTLIEDYYNKKKIIYNYGDEIDGLIKKEKLKQKEFNNNTVTIFVSGFLTENKNSFAECYKDYSFKDNLKSDYYFYLWPSCAAPDEGLNFLEKIDEIKDFANGLGCKFEEAYKNATISGEILSFIIGSKNFFGDAKINLVGHSLGCRVIYYCLIHLNITYKDLKGVINDVIFLAGATELVDNSYFNKIVNEYVNGRFIHCFNKDDEALFISQPFANLPIGMRELEGDKFENYETDLSHTNYCKNLDFILDNIENEYNGKKISFI